MADFQALVTAVLDSSKLTDQIKNACNQPVTISGIRVDPSALRSSIQSALSGQTFNIDTGNINLSNLNRQMQTFGTSAGKRFSQNFNSELSHITHGNSAYINNIQQILTNFKFDKASVDEITRGFNSMDIAISKVKTSINNGNLRITVTGIDEIGNAVNIIKEIDSETGKVRDIGQTISREFDSGARSAKQFQDTLQSIGKSLSVDDITKQLSQVSKQFDSIALLRTSGNSGISEKALNIESQIDGLRNLRSEILNLAATGDQSGLATAFELFETSIANVRNAIQSLKNDTGSLSSDIAKALNGAGNNKKINSDITDLETKFNKLQDVVTNFQDGRIKNNLDLSLHSISYKLSSLRSLSWDLSNPSDMSGEQLTAKWDEYLSVLSRVRLEIENLSGPVKQFQDVFSGGITLDFKKLESDFNSLSNTSHSKLPEIAEDIETLRSLTDVMMNTDATEDEVTSALNKYQVISERVRNSIKEVKLESKDFTETYERGISQINTGKLTKDLSSIERQFRKLEKSGHGGLDTLKKDYEKLIQLQNKMDQQLKDNDKKGFVDSFKQYEETRTKLVNSLATLRNQSAGVINPLISGLKSYAAQFFSIYQIVAQFKKGFEFVKDLNDAVTNISYTMDVSEAQLDTYKSKVVSMANEFKSSAKTIVEASTLYANANESIDSILKKTETATMLSNVTGMSGTDTAKMLQAIMNQFDLGQDDLLMISDTIQSVSQSMAYDFSDGIQEIYDGIKASGSVANEAGLSLAQYSSMLGTVIEQTGNDGGQVGNAFKTIFTRITKASATAGTMEEDISKAEESLRAVGVEVRSSSGEFRNLDDILGDLAQRWDTLSDVEKSNISYNVAGTRQTNILKSLMKAWDDYQTRVHNATNLTESPTLTNQEKYAESLSGKLNDLTASAQAFWATLINDGDAEKVIGLFSGAIDVVTKFTQVFGSLSTVTAGLGIASLFKRFA